MSVHPSTPEGSVVERVRRRFVEQGLEAALVRKPQDRPSRQSPLSSEGMKLGLDIQNVSVILKQDNWAQLSIKDEGSSTWAVVVVGARMALSRPSILL